MSTSFDLQSNCKIQEKSVNWVKEDNIPQTILPTDKPVTLQLRWDISGLPDLPPPGDWQVRVFLESIGPTNDLMVISAEVPARIDFSSRRIVIDKTFTVNSGIVPMGAYKTIATITRTNSPLNDFIEGPVVQFYDSDVSRKWVG